MQVCLRFILFFVVGVLICAYEMERDRLRVNLLQKFRSEEECSEEKKNGEAVDKFQL